MAVGGPTPGLVSIIASSNDIVLAIAEASSPSGSRCASNKALKTRSSLPATIWLEADDEERAIERVLAERPCELRETFDLSGGGCLALLRVHDLRSYRLYSSYSHRK
jgi:hypothetical protein